MTSKIEWTDQTWNPVTGCTKVSPGCRNCYAERMATRLGGRYGYPADEPFRVTMHPDRPDQPLRWRKPRHVFVVSMGDLFHADVPFDYIDAVFGVMATAYKHTFQVLTKRPERMREWFHRVEDHPGMFFGAGAMKHFASDEFGCFIENYVNGVANWREQGSLVVGDGRYGNRAWPLPNVWLGTTVEDQQRADERIPLLLQCPAAVRFVSVEPMLGAVDLESISLVPPRTPSHPHIRVNALTGLVAGPDEYHPEMKLDWVICGGESGHGARPMHPDWARSLRDQCRAAGVPFMFKQWGAWAPGEDIEANGTDWSGMYEEDSRDGGVPRHHWPDSPHRKVAARHGRPVPESSCICNDTEVLLVGKKAAGRLLDGALHDGMPGRDS